MGERDGAQPAGPPLRIPRDKLIFWSICALEQRAGDAADDPMRPDFAIKAVLAFLYAIGCDRSCVDGYWRAMIAVHPAGYSPSQAKYVRETTMQTAIKRIMRSLQVGGPLFDQELAEALHGPAGHEWSQRKRMIDRLRQERQQAAAERRADRDCGWL